MNEPLWVKYKEGENALSELVSSSFENVMPEVNIDLFDRKAVSFKVKINYFVNTDLRIK